MAEAAPKKTLRTGFTTGSCATAAATAALQALLTRRAVQAVEVELPAGERVTFQVAECTIRNGEATCGVVKDAGDDPDVTHGATIQATVSRTERPGIQFEAGEGVGVVTRPGLGIPVGEPDITRRPRKMMEESIRALVGDDLKTRGVRVVLSVPGGAEMAKKTELSRLGVVGGIAILGNTGIVRPYSTAAFRAGITAAVQVASEGGLRRLVITTGGQSEKAAMRLFPDLPETAFIQMGDFAGHALKECARRRIERVTIVGFPGKLSKIAAGKMQTHAAGSDVDIGFLAGFAAACGAGEEVMRRLKEATTARHFMELVLDAKVPGVFDAICRRICEQARRHIQEALAVEAIITDFEGRPLGRCTTPEQPPRTA